MSQTDKHFEDQLEGEEVLFVFRKHPFVMRKGLILSMLTLLLGTVPSLIKPEYIYLFGGLAAGLVLAVIVMIPSWITWYYSVYIVTDQRFLQVSQKGLWKKSVVDISLSQIQMVNYEVAGFQETTLGFGTIMMQTYVGDLVIHEVYHPAKIQKQLLEVLREKGVIASVPPQLQQAQDNESH